MKRSTTTLLAALAALAAQAQQPAPPALPSSQVLRFQTEVVSEKIEAVAVPRLRMTGHRTITMDLIPGFTIGSQPGYSVAFARENGSEVKAGLIAFPARFFAADLNPAVLSRYLGGRAGGFPADRNFEVLEAPAENSGPARFRFLGTKAYTLRYAYDEPGADGHGARKVRGESWNLMDGVFYVFVVEAPADFFDGAFETVRRAASTMHFAGP